MRQYHLRSCKSKRRGTGYRETCFQTVSLTIPAAYVTSMDSSYVIGEMAERSKAHAC